jgi:hypothetical protein
MYRASKPRAAVVKEWQVYKARALREAAEAGQGNRRNILCHAMLALRASTCSGPRMVLEGTFVQRKACNFRCRGLHISNILSF